MVIKDKVEKDEHLNKIIAKLKKEEGVCNYSMQHRMLRYKGTLVLSKSSSLTPTILHTYHDSIFGGHSRFLRIYKRLTGELFSKGMKHDVKKYCEECLMCQ